MDAAKGYQRSPGVEFLLRSSKLYYHPELKREFDIEDFFTDLSFPADAIKYIIDKKIDNIDDLKQYSIAHFQDVPSLNAGHLKSLSYYLKQPAIAQEPQQQAPEQRQGKNI